MKRLLYIPFVGLLLLSPVITGCSDGIDNPYPDETLIVTKADVLFQALGGKGVIEVQTEAVLEATSNKSWCSLVVSGNQLLVEISAYDGLEARNALVTIHSERRSCELTITQEGAVVWFEDFDMVSREISFSPKGDTISSAVHSSYPVEVVDKPDWVSYHFEENRFYLIADGVNKPRKGSIAFKSNNRDLVFQVGQIGYDSFLGEWEFAYTDPAKLTERQTINVTLSKNEEDDTSFILGPIAATSSVDCYLKADYIPGSSNLVIQCTQYLGQNPALPSYQHIYLCFITASNYTWDSSLQIQGLFSLSETGEASYTFRVPNSLYRGFGLFGFPSLSPGSGGGYYRRMMDIIMTKK